MRLGIDMTSWSNRRGYGRFTRGLVPALLQIGAQHDYVFFLDSQSADTEQMPEGVETIVARTSEAPTRSASAQGRRSLRDLWAMTTTVAREPLDALFFPTVYTYFPVRTRATILLGVHDVIAEDYPDEVFPDARGRRWWNLKTWLGHRQAEYIVTVSEHARQGILRRFDHDPDRVWVLEEAPDPIFRPVSEAEVDRELLRRHGLHPGSAFLVYLGGINPHKNLIALVEAITAVKQRPPYAALKLVVIGDITSDVFAPGLAPLRARVEALGLEEDVVFTGFIEDAKVVHFLNAALAVVLPSLAEGFGLPAVEGAACGTPVIATRNSPLPDLLRGGGMFFDPTEVGAIESSLLEFLGDEAAQDQMARRAREQASRLTWDRSARQFLALLSRIERLC